MRKTELILLVVVSLLLVTACEKDYIENQEEYVEHIEHVVLSLQPDGVLGKDAVFSKINSENNYGNKEDIHLYTWTQGGGVNVNRVTIDFDLSSIPADAQIDSAFLSLYFNDHSVYGSEHVGDNSFVIQRITSAWEESSVTWNTQPTSSSINEIIVPGSISPTQDFTGIDITALMRDMRLEKDNSFGLLLKLVSEEPYKILLLASSDNSKENIRPKLDIYYTIKE